MLNDTYSYGLRKAMKIIHDYADKYAGKEISPIQLLDLVHREIRYELDKITYTSSEDN